MQLMEREIYRFDEFELQPSRRVLLRGGERVNIAPKTFEVMLCLVRSPGRVLRKDELLKAVWPDSFVEESNLTQHIFWLRKALGDRSGYIVTIPGRGYEFTGLVESVPESRELAAPPVAATAAALPTMEVHVAQTYEMTQVVMEETVYEAPRGMPQSGGSRWFPWVASAAVLVAAVAGVVRWREMSAVAAGDHHEVVLADFENTTGDSGFDSALKTLLRIDLNESHYLVVADESDTTRAQQLMDRPPGAALTPATAREVCQRLNDQVVISGLIANFGRQYLLTLTATDCTNGKILVQSKATAGEREGVLTAIDQLAGEMRRRLGESMPARSGSSAPLQMAHTFSLDALRAYSQAQTLEFLGRKAEAVPLLERALQLDPKFAEAYLELADCYLALHEPDKARGPVEKAYELRDQDDDSVRIKIVSEYNRVVTEDEHAELRELGEWTQLYPNQVQPWMELANREYDLGSPELAVEPARRAVAVAPDNGWAYGTLGYALLHSGHPDEAKAACAEAVRRRVDTALVHMVIYEIAYLQHDSTAWDAEMQWARQQGQAEERSIFPMLTEGKVHAAVGMWLRILAQYRKDGFPEKAERDLRRLMRREADYDMKTELLEQMATIDPLKYPQNVVMANAAIGRVDVAEAGLKAMGATMGTNTALREYYYPQAMAAVALAQHKPDEAIAILEPTRSYDLAGLEGPLLRGRAYLAAGKAELAAGQFRIIIDHPFIAAIMPFHPLAHLGLARALAMEGDVAGSRREYETLFALWKDADADLPPLVQARAEYARLR